MSLKERIKELANAKGISLPTLEAELGFGNSTIVKWDKSTPNAEKLNAVAKYFNVSMDYLLNGEENQINDSFNESELNNVYFSLAKEAQENNIDPRDIKMALEMLKKLREEK